MKKIIFFLPKLILHDIFIKFLIIQYLVENNQEKEIILSSNDKNISTLFVKNNIYTTNI